MKREIKILFITAVIILSATDIFCQDKMMSIDIIRGRFSDYVKAVPFEDIYIHTDRESYTAGESVWFSTWLSDRVSGKLSDESSIAYVEILDPYNRPVVQAKALLEKGTGTGLIELPDTLINGSYTLRAYTNRMKSFMPEGCFMKQITVINPFSDRFLNFRKTIKAVDEKPFRIGFYPEGGKLIAGLACRLGITVLNKMGEPVRCSGVIKSEEGDTVTVADIDSSGISSVTITPVAGQALFFEAENRGGVFALPPVSGTGSAIRVMRSGNDSLVVSLLSNNYRGTWQYLIIQSRGAISHAARIRVTGEETVVRLRGEVLGAGINDIALFDASGILLSERLVLKAPAEDSGLRIDCSPVYRRREKAEIVIVNDGALNPQIDLTDLSISVSLHPGSKDFTGADESLLTGTEYILPEAGSMLPEVFQSLSPDKKDVLLLGTKSLWINWNEILNGRWKKPGYPFEKEGQYVSVSFFDRRGLPPPNGSKAFMTSPGKRPEFQYSVIDSTGRFSFFIRNDSQLKDFVFQPADTSGSYTAKIESQFSDKYMSSGFIADTSRQYIPEETAMLARNFQIQKIYENHSAGDTIVPPLKSPVRPRFYGKPDQELVMDEYIALATMREVFFELVRKVTVRTNRKENSFTIYDPVLKKNPALFVDGVPIDDAAKIINMNPAHVEQIDVILGDYRIGDLIFPGIINVTTRSGNYSDLPLPENAVRVVVKMFGDKVAFISPDYSTEEEKKQRIPDFRNTLYWNPRISPDVNGKMSVGFRTSDLAAEYLIVLEGISSTGKVVSVRKALRVE